MEHFINGEWQEGTGTAFTSENPATGDVIWTGKACAQDEVKKAVQAARDAWPKWQALSFSERLQYLEKYIAALTEARETMTTVIAQDTGKPWWEAGSEVTAAINKLAISVEAYQERSGFNEEAFNSAKATTQHKSHGVLAVLGPFNFPLHLPNGHIIPALLAGNTIVFKPSELTPLTAQHMMTLMQTAGLPAGVVNVVQGGRETGDALLNEDVNGVLFTGSYATGKFLHERFAGRPEILLALELGGNNPLIVSDVEDIEAAVYHTIQSAFISAGQRCTCARRLIVVGSQEPFIEKLIHMTGQLVIGQYQEQPEPFMGPVISCQATQRLLDTQDAWVKRGARALLPLTRLQRYCGFVTPGIIDVTDIEVDDEELFGPLLQVIRVDDMQRAIEVANQTKFGLAAGLLGDSQEDFSMMMGQVRAGIVNWNQALTGARSQAPFGGVGCSGNYHPSAFYAADYCAYPVASLLKDICTLPDTLSPGIRLS